MACACRCTRPGTSWGARRCGGGTAGGWGGRGGRNGARVSLHPAGHILGSAQVRVEHRGEVWVVSGDYKTEADPTCSPFELGRCHTFVTESTLGPPIYR